MTVPAPLHEKSSSKLLRVKQQALSNQHRHLLLRPLEMRMPLKLSLHIQKIVLQVTSWLGDAAACR